MKNPNWQEANQLAICTNTVEELNQGLPEQIQLLLRAGLELQISSLVPCTTDIVTFLLILMEKKTSAFPARDLEACTHFWAKTDHFTFAQLHIPVCITIRIHKHLTQTKLQ